MNTDEIYLTADGARQLRKELQDLTGPKRKELADRLRVAIQQGDLTENADYITTKEEQGFLEGRIQEIEYLLRNAVIVEQPTEKQDEVSLGVRVTIQIDDSPAETYQLVGIKEANPKNGCISYESPIGKALIGKREGDQFLVETPGGEINIKILEID
ncbi:MAG: transcription elongation factor GreA [Chloroflexota bacterium]